MPPPSIAVRQIKRPRSSTPSSHNPFLVFPKQFPTASLYASSPMSKREVAQEGLPSSDDLGPVVLELEGGLVVDNEMDVDPVPSSEHHPVVEEDLFSD
jgi:hypothetical protein